MDQLKELKKKYLFNDEGLIREGLSMKEYADILYSEDEDELDKVITDLMTRRGNSGDVEIESNDKEEE